MPQVPSCKRSLLSSNALRVLSIQQGLPLGVLAVLPTCTTIKGTSLRSRPCDSKRKRLKPHWPREACCTGNGYSQGEIIHSLPLHMRPLDRCIVTALHVIIFSTARHAYQGLGKGWSRLHGDGATGSGCAAMKRELQGPRVAGGLGQPQKAAAEAQAPTARAGPTVRSRGVGGRSRNDGWLDRARAFHQQGSDFCFPSSQSIHALAVA